MQEPSTISFWHDSMPTTEWVDRPELAGTIDVDVAIVGAGFTGLWTAYYLHLIDTSLAIAVIDANIAGFGASGRNGGWCSALLPMGLDAIAAQSTPDAAVRLQRAMFHTVAEVGHVAAAEGIDCDFAAGGYVHLARTQPQLQRICAEIDELHRWGFTDGDHRLLDATEAAAVVNASKVVGAGYTPHCAAIHPTKLVRGLARVVEAQGTTIYEHTSATAIEPNRVTTDHGSINARFVVRATEAFTPTLPGQRRAVAPIYSLMVATEQLPESFFDEVGLARREVFNDGRRMVIYGQRTVDNRLAFGGRGAPYHFASRIDPRFDRHEGVHALLRATLADLFPQLRDVAITHRWGGAVAAPRDWWCSVGLDTASGMAWAGGYVGDGVSTTNLAGRTLADLITGRTTELTNLPWVGHRSRRWEPEPLRWLGINTLVKLPDGADAYEARTGKTERWRSSIINRITGH